MSTSSRNAKKMKKKNQSIWKHIYAYPQHIIYYNKQFIAVNSLQSPRRDTPKCYSANAGMLDAPIISARRRIVKKVPILAARARVYV